MNGTIFPAITPRRTKSEYPPLMVDAWSADAIFAGRMTELRRICRDDKKPVRKGHVSWIREPQLNTESWGYPHTPVASELGRSIMAEGITKDGVVMVDPLDIEIVGAQYAPAQSSRGAVRITDLHREPLNEMTAEDAIRCGHPRNGRTDVEVLARYRYRWDARHRKHGCMWADNPVVWVIRFELVQMPELQAILDNVTGTLKTPSW